MVNFDDENRNELNNIKNKNSDAVNQGIDYNFSKQNTTAIPQDAENITEVKQPDYQERAEDENKSNVNDLVFIVLGKIDIDNLNNNELAHFTIVV